MHLEVLIDLVDHALLHRGIELLEVGHDLRLPPVVSLHVLNALEATIQDVPAVLVILESLCCVSYVFFCARVVKKKERKKS